MTAGITVQKIHNLIEEQEERMALYSSLGKKLAMNILEIIWNDYITL